MKKLFNETRELDFSELLDVNGGYSSKSTLNNRERFSIIDGKGYSSTTGFIGAPKPGNFADYLSASVPLDQQGFDKEYGFSNGSLKDTKSCKTAALINTYAAEDGLSKETLDKVVETWKANNWIDTDGSPLDINRMSESLAKAMGRDTHYEIPGGYDKSGNWVSTTIDASDTNAYQSYGVRIVKSYNKTLNSFHYTLDYGNYGKIDSLNPYRKHADGYIAETFQPMVLVNNRK